MRIKNLKFHLIAIGSISLIVVVLFAIMRPSAQPVVDPNLPTGDRYIRMDSATFGQNCNELIAIERKKPLQRNEDGTVQPAPQLVQRNNAMLALSRLCDGKLQCSTPVTEELFQSGVNVRCYRKLKYSYRCFTIDRLWVKEISEGDTLTIDCHAPASDAASATSAPVTP